MKAEKILVTGGAGFIGSYLSDGLMQEGYEVRVLDDLSVGKIEHVPEGCEFIQGSLLDETILDRALTGVAHICHEAALVSVRGSVEKFYEDARTNLMGTLLLLKKAAEHSIQRFLYASSMAVYADTASAEPINENHPAIPVSPYGIGKLAAERYVMMIGPRLGMEPVVLRYFNTFGERQSFTPYVGVITIFVTRLLQQQDITIFGDGKQCRDFVHVSDVVQANLLSLKKPQAVGKVFNIGSGRGATVMELATLLKQEIYPKATIHHAPRREEELRNSIADISLAARILSYSPRTDLQRQIQEVIHSLR